MSTGVTSEPAPLPVTIDRRSRLRQFAVVVYMPPDLEEVIAPLRERFDPDYNLIAAHMTLVFPFETERTIDELSSRLQPVAGETKPIGVELDSIGDFYPQYPVIFWRVLPDERLNQLQKVLYSALEIPTPQSRFVPHVTVAKEISHHRLVLVKDEIAAFLPRERLQLESFDLVSPVADRHWVSVRTFALAGE